MTAPQISTNPPEAGLRFHGPQWIERVALVLNVLGVASGLVMLYFLLLVLERSHTFVGVHPMAILVHPVHTLPIYCVNLLALRSASKGNDGYFTSAWCVCLLWLSALAYLLLLGQVLTALGLTGTEPVHRASRFAPAVLPLLTWTLTLSALRVRRVFRPAWWMNVLFLPPLVVLSVITVSERASDWCIGRLRGPQPDDFGGSLTWSIENNDLIEAMPLLILVFLFLWSIYIGFGVFRASPSRSVKGTSSRVDPVESA